LQFAQTGRGYLALRGVSIGFVIALQLHDVVPEEEIVQQY
jgi:hypothetical protein